MREVRAKFALAACSRWSAAVLENCSSTWKPQLLLLLDNLISCVHMLCVPAVIGVVCLTNQLQYTELHIWPRLPGCALCNSACLFSSEQELFAEFNCCEKYVYSLGSYCQLAFSSSCLAFFFDANMNISLSGRDTAYLNRESAVSRRLKGWGKKLLREENWHNKDWWAMAEKLVIEKSLFSQHAKALWL